MDYWKKYRFSDYFLTMANLEANQLASTANTVSLLHLKDGFVRMDFQDNVQAFINAQLNVIRSGGSDEACQECIQNLKQEREYLNIQDRMLRTGEAAVHPSVKFYHDNEKIIGYIIDGIGVVLGGLQIVAGAGFLIGGLGTGNVIGMVAGTSMIFNGLGSSIESIQKLVGSSNPENFVLNKYEEVAEFLGFDRKIGLLAYQTVDLTTSWYGVFKLTIKPEAWRLFHYLPSDSYRKIETLSKPALAIKGVSAAYSGIKIGNNIYEVNKDKQ